MEFRIADTFTASLAKLGGEDQKQVKTTAFDLQLNPSNPGHQFHKLDRAKDPRFWSVRVSRDIRLIVHRTETSLLVCYVDHHDDAYRWAERRRLETHPKTGAAQLVEIRQIVRNEEAPRLFEVPAISDATPAAAPKPRLPLFAGLSEDALLAYGVPPEWIGEARTVDEEGLLELTDHLPAEAAEALFQLATGSTPAPAPAAPVSSPFEHPDARRRFRTVANLDELKEALDYPWEKWAIFLHPAQREAVERDYSGPARVAGSAGTGKTVVALHRAVHLAKQNPESKVLLTTFSPLLAGQLRTKVRRLLADDPRVGERLEVADLNEVGRRLFEARLGKARLATPDQISDVLAEASSELEGHRFTHRFLLSEWSEIVDAWQISTWEHYRDVRRLGRKTRLPEAPRAILWSIFEAARLKLEALSLITSAQMFTALAAVIEGKRPPYEFVVVDEAQDISIPQLRFLAAMAGDRPGALFFAGDLGQRIFQTPFSWLSLGVDVRGRSRTLKINYRTSHQIRSQADRLLGPIAADVDGNQEDRRGTISVFDGPAPTIHVAASPDDEAQFVASWVKSLSDLAPHEICLIVRSERELARGESAAAAADLPFKLLDGSAEPRAGSLSVCTMHNAKGLEFRAVAVMACDEGILPSQDRIATVADESDLDEVYNTERHLLYVACTRARDHLLLTSGGNPSEFLDDLR
jgi:mRNA-degrading endonuclease RelE of RelBE toxin-antitoxin system